MLHAVEEVFEEVRVMLHINVTVQLELTSKPPKSLLDRFAAGGMDIAVDIVDGDIPGLSGCYSPIARKNNHTGEVVLDAHRVWIRDTQDAVEACIAFIHELVHASQAEGYGVERAQAMSAHFIQVAGYEHSPFEIEAESMARFMVHELGLTPLIEKEV